MIIDITQNQLRLVTDLVKLAIADCSLKIQTNPYANVDDRLYHLSLLQLWRRLSILRVNDTAYCRRCEAFVNMLDGEDTCSRCNLALLVTDK
jgi:hypothetical protein